MTTTTDYLDYTITLESPYHDGRATMHPWYFEPSDYEAESIDNGDAFSAESAIEEAQQAIRDHYQRYWKVEATINPDSIVVLHYRNNIYSVEFRASQWDSVEDTYLDSTTDDAKQAQAVADWIKGIYPSATIEKMHDYEESIK